MLIRDENDHTIVVESLLDPLVSEYFWILDLNLMDFTLSKIVTLEEITCTTLQLDINGFRFHVPANWNMLIYSTETQQLDVVEMGELAGRDFHSFVYGPNKRIPEGYIVKVVDYSPKHVNVVPGLSRHQMLCHPISDDEWVNIAPSDTYNRYLRNMVVGDLIQ